MRDAHSGSRCSAGPLALLLAGACLAGASAPMADGAPDEAVAALDHAGVRTGLCVHVCSGKGLETAALGGNGRMIVHALAPGEEAARAVREKVRARGLYGLVSVEARTRLDALPYAKHLVNLVVVDDLVEATGRALSWPEVLRIVVPRGIVLVGGATVEAVEALLAKQHLLARVEQVSPAGRWVRIRTVRPAWMGEWTHGGKHDAGGGGLGDDRADPQGLGRAHRWIQWIDAEHRPADHGSMTSLAAAGGLLVTITNAETIAHARDGLYWQALGGRRGNYVLSVRDAYNGTLHWTRPWRGWAKATRQLAVLDDLIYTIERDKLTATDARDGTIRFAAELPGAPSYEDELACCPEGVAVHRRSTGVIVFDARTGAPKWKHDGRALKVVADGGRLYVNLLPDLDPGARQRLRTTLGFRPPSGGGVVAFDLTSGRTVWQKDAAELSTQHAGAEPIDPATGASLCSAARGRVLLALGRRKVLVLSGDNGQLERELDLGEPAGGIAASIVDDCVLVRTGRSMLFDLKTGKLIREGASPHATGRWGCSPGSASEQMFLDHLKPAPPAGYRPPGWHEFLGTQGASITCVVGPAFANGMLYQPQQYCGCGPGGKTTGLIATSAMAPPPPREAFAEPGPVEKGPAYGRAAAGEGPPGDWPMFRADAQRSCAAAGTLPDGLEVLWTAHLTLRRPDCPIIAHSWRGQHFHNGTITAPVVAGGRLCAALVDEHQVVALDATNGKVLWRFTANGRIDSPPTLHAGLCLFGCRDGWVYCLSAADGKLAWRRRVTPVDERIAVYGQLEARFPVIGSVLVEDGTAYATAGLTGQLGIMLLKFEPRTGRKLAYVQLRRGAYLNDVLLKAPGGKIVLVRWALDQLMETDPRKGLPQEPGLPLQSGHSGILSAIRTRSAHSLCRSRGLMTVEGLQAYCWAWRGAKAFGLTTHQVLPEHVRSMRRSKAFHPGFPYVDVKAPAVFAVDADKLDGQPGSALLWQQPMKEAWAMAAAENRLVAAGPVPEDRRRKDDLRTDWRSVLVKIGQPATKPARGFTPGMFQRMAAEADARQQQADAAIKQRAERLEALIKSEIPKDIPQGNDPLWRPAEVWDAWQPVSQDPLCAKGELKVFDIRTGRPVASLSLPATVVQDGVAVVRGRIYLATADGAVLCIGRK